MPSNRKRIVKTEEPSSLFGEEEGVECPVCRQEYLNGICPISSADCPYREGAGEEDEAEDEEETDFEDVKHLADVLEEDEEADRLTDEKEDFSEGDGR